MNERTTDQRGRWHFFSDPVVTSGVMLPGFNHNLRHKGTLFHIQTEDGGEKSPTIITHVFHGGNIIASRRQDYRKFLRSPDLKDLVQSIMKEQHKQMMKDIVNGKSRAVQEILTKIADGKVETSQEADESSQGPAAIPSPQPAKSMEADATSPTPDSSRTLDTTTSYVDKTLDELILEFLSDEEEKKT